MDAQTGIASEVKRPALFVNVSLHLRGNTRQTTLLTNGISMIPTDGVMNAQTTMSFLAAWLDLV